MCTPLMLEGDVGILSLGRDQNILNVMDRLSYKGGLYISSVVFHSFSHFEMQSQKFKKFCLWHPHF